MTKTRNFFFICALLLASLACNFGLGPSTAGPASLPTADQTAEISGADIEYYDIEGSAATDLRDQMNTLGPIDNGRHWDAYTAWYVRWNWPGYGTNDCNLSKATTSIDVTVTMPRWANPKGADAALITQWNKYYQALARHEQEHVENITEGYPDVLQAIQSATCATAEQAAMQALEPIHEADRSYDDQTNHGATQGARFP